LPRGCGTGIGAGGGASTIGSGSGCSCSTSSGAAIISVKSEDQPLEDIYFALVGDESGEEGGA